MKVHWSPINSICRDVARLAGGGVSCWVQSHSGELLAGELGSSASSEVRRPLCLQQEETATVCVAGPGCEVWLEPFVSFLQRELDHQATVADMADVTARLWRHTNALMRMAASAQLSEEPARIIDAVLGILARATRFEHGLGLVRLPHEDSYSVFREGGVDAISPLVLAPLHAINDKLRLIGTEREEQPIMDLCSNLLGSRKPLAVARLATERDMFGFLLAPVREAESATSEDLKMLLASAQVLSVAIENGYTLIKERAATRLQVENELLSGQARDMEEIVHIVAHDLRSPMTSMYGFMHVALDELKDLRARLEEEGYAPIGPYADQVAEPLRDGIRSVEKLNRMVQRLLDFSRAARETYSFEELALDKLVHGVIRSLSYQIDKHAIEVEVEKLPSVMVDRVQIEAVFGNLIDNAIKYMGGGPQRRIMVGRKYEPKPVYYVRDTGIGMTPEQVSKAFLPFQRFHTDAAPGDGIGLTHVRKIIERHGGTIWCESEKDVGTTFYFTLGDRQVAAKPLSAKLRKRQAQSTTSLSS